MIEQVKQGPRITFRRDGSGYIQFETTAQLALLDVREVLEFAQEAQRRFCERSELLYTTIGTDTA